MQQNNSEKASLEVDIQRQYYSSTAENYNEMHVCESDEHYLALSFMLQAIDYLKIKSVLDVGSGTGRAVAFIKEKRPDIKVVGVEPVQELREVGYNNGLTKDDIVNGDVMNLQFSNDEFDLVCEFGVLHHVRNPDVAVDEMLRVGKKAVFISDSNNFGQGSFIGRMIKQTINSLGLWKIADYIKTKGKGYSISEGDGLAYSYSVFNNYKQIAQSCKIIHLLNTKGRGINPYRTASHVALLGVKI